MDFKRAVTRTHRSRPNRSDYISENGLNWNGYGLNDCIRIACQKNVQIVYHILEGYAVYPQGDLSCTYVHILNFIST
jgi:hypothetical protein